MKKEKKQTAEPYKVIMHEFVGDSENFTYKMTLNKSLVHTGKWKGIENGLNRYDKLEPFYSAFDHLKGFFVSIWYGLRYLFS